MRTISNSYVSRVLFAVPPFDEPRRLRRGGASLFDSYRLELDHTRAQAQSGERSPPTPQTNGMRARDSDRSEPAAD